MKYAMILLPFLSSNILAATYYVSPNGSDANNCTAAQSQATPKKTFVSFFSCGTAGDTFVVMSTAAYTTYAGATTGYMSYDDGSCTNCEQPPSGTSTSVMTNVQAQYSTNTVVIDGGSRQGLFIGRSNRKDQFIKIQGLTFHGGGILYNTDHVYIKSCGIYGTAQDGGDVFGIGTNDGNWWNTNNLIEDTWVWGKNRLIASNYRASNTIWRRVFVRGDGCNTGACTGSGNPNVGFTVYNSSNVSVQNMMIIDRSLGGGEPYADFASAQHNAGPNDTGATEYNQKNEWLGCLSLNSSDSGQNFECDGCTSPSVKIVDMAIVDPSGGGINVGNNNAGVTVKNVTILNVKGAGESGVRLAPGVTGGEVTNVIVSTAPQWGVNSAVQPSYSDVYNATVDAYNQTTCAVGCLTTNARADGTPPSIKYIPRIESGSALKGTGSGGTDYGANLLYEYGVDGKYNSESSSNTLTANSLWPWDNETRIKREMCTNVSTNWCGTTKTLTQYVWDYLGNTDGPYGSNPPGGESGVYVKARASGKAIYRGVSFK